MNGWQAAAILGALLITLLAVFWLKSIEIDIDHEQRITRIEEQQK